MEDKKTKGLDISRLVIAILIFAGGILAGITAFLIIYGLFTANNEDGFSGLIFLFIIPLIIGSLAYLIVGIKWIKKYNQTKDLPLSKRTTNSAESIVKIIVSIIFLSYFCIPFVIYWIMDLIEAGKRKELMQKLKADRSQPEFKTNETYPISDKHFCKYCGKEIDYRYARFCEHCGKEIEFRK